MDILEILEGSWQTCQIHVGYKDIVIKLSSSIRHATKLYDIFVCVSVINLYFYDMIDGMWQSDTTAT